MNTTLKYRLAAILLVLTVVAIGSLIGGDVIVKQGTVEGDNFKSTGCTASGTKSVALGTNTTAEATNSFAIGNGITNSTAESFVVGFGGVPGLSVSSTLVKAHGTLVVDEGLSCKYFVLPSTYLDPRFATDGHIFINTETNCVYLYADGEWRVLFEWEE